ncbi:NAD-dependent epimerase/dehydratase family protein [Rhizobium sp. SL42]|uniref:NAD-dependent epimerase/dehydratase family protein n=1 Tax=Rhizobium sp. SL42 TaxID=2806346 RepID=UPI001F20DDCC|nr:NAD(P)-dependent oxidoreductase [Rhizobium sp. SL42]UJW74560.1 NAD(P)-dependent oxidoreductase [Rhizobium sp. SL42]
MKVLVSGGTGLVGRYLVEGLLSAGYAVTIGGRTAPACDLFAADVDFMPLSLEPGAGQPGLFEGFDHFVHAAFDHLPGLYRGGEGADADGFVRRNLDGTVSLFESARQEGVRRCIFLSSRAVYDGLPDGSVLSEDADVRPTTLYGQVKLKAEQALHALSTAEFCGVSLRVTGVYGHLRPNKWDGLFADYLAGRTIESRAGSEVHGSDVADAVRLLLEVDAVAMRGRIFNVSDVVTDRHEILRWVQAVTGVDHALPLAVDQTMVACMETERMRSLGWRPGGKVRMEETVRRLAARWI